MDYEPAGYRDSDLIKLDILVNGNPVDALSIISHKDKAYERGRGLIGKLRSLIPRQLYEVAIPGRDRKQGDSPRIREGDEEGRHLEVLRGGRHQEKKTSREAERGKKRMKQVGRVEIPQEAFLAVLKND